MAKSRKNRNFSEATKRLLGERVAYVCSHPLCRRLTIKAHPTDRKANRLGEAGHIFSASKQGPRYDPSKTDSFIRSFENGIWLCSNCHKLVDSETSKYNSSTLSKWKDETENYVETLVIQDTRLRQLRLICQALLTSLRILSGLPNRLDHTLNNPTGNGINLTRMFMDLELTLFANDFIEEEKFVIMIRNDLDRIICPLLNGNNTGRLLNISDWKNAAVRIMTLNVMRFDTKSYQRYLVQESEMTSHALTMINYTPEKIDLKSTGLGKIEHTMKPSS